jgi:hypothetical protein
VNSRLYSHFMILIISLCFVHSYGQGKYHFFYGKVQNKYTSIGIYNVNITFEGLKTGSVTDKKGAFSVYIDTLPVIMVLSHIGYETKFVFLDNTSFSLIIDMVPQVKELREVEIKGSEMNADPVVKASAFSVLDYEPDSGNVYMLISRFRTNDVLLVLLSGSGDTIARRVCTEFSPRKLFKDCLGYIHILANDSAYQIFHSGNNLLLLYSTTLKRFKNLLSDCVLSTNDLLFYKKTIEHDQGVSYFTVKRIARERQNLSTIKDSSKLMMAKKNPGDWNLLLRKRIPEGREDFVSWSYVHKILYRPLSSCLFKIESQICVLNTSEHTIEFYQPNGTYSSKLLIKVNKSIEGKWSGELYIDEISSKVYTTFFKNGEYEVYRLNLNTGELIRRAKIDKLFPDKVCIHNGFIYFLFRENGVSMNVDLYRQKL